ncbi:serine/threonine-protein kinase [Streptomyces goshikiensis]|uniref:serine/threonine-protein kinase n=1 Tax=Streptomyces goshikiensis TaxID=1942 RepID=UPI0036AE56BB
MLVGWRAPGEQAENGRPPGRWEQEVRSAAGRDDPEFRRVPRERVLREARAQARINHPNVVTIHHIVDEGEHPWLVMELLPGHSLGRRLEQGPLPPAEAARIGREVLAGLRAAHAGGIRHRDVKPANVLMRADGSAVLTDFGIAALQDAASLTLTGEITGTPAYLAPERIRGADLPAVRSAVAGNDAVRVRGRHQPDAPCHHLGHPGRDPAERPAAERLDRLLTAVAEGTGSALPPEPTRLDRAPDPPCDVSSVPDRAPTAGRFGPPPYPPAPGPPQRSP